MPTSDLSRAADRTAAELAVKGDHFLAYNQGLLSPAEHGALTNLMFAGGKRIYDKRRDRPTEETIQPTEKDRRTAGQAVYRLTTKYGLDVPPENLVVPPVQTFFPRFLKRIGWYPR